MSKLSIRERIQKGHRYIDARRPRWNKGDLKLLRTKAPALWRDICEAEAAFDAEAAECGREPERDQEEFDRLGRLWVEAWTRGAEWLQEGEEHGNDSKGRRR